MSVNGALLVCSLKSRRCLVVVEGRALRFSRWVHLSFKKGADVRSTSSWKLEGIDDDAVWIEWVSST